MSGGQSEVGLRDGDEPRLDVHPYPVAAGPDADPDWYHSVHGNPMRFDGAFTIRPDVEWHDAMPATTKTLVTLLTQPFLSMHRLGVGFTRYQGTSE